MFADKYGVEVKGKSSPMQTATAENITIINFGMGSPNAALIMDLLSAIKPKAVLFLGKCGGLKKQNKVDEAIQVCLEGLAIAEKLKSRREIAMLATNLGYIYLSKISK